MKAPAAGALPGGIFPARNRLQPAAAGRLHYTEGMFFLVPLVVALIAVAVAVYAYRRF